LLVVSAAPPNGAPSLLSGAPPPGPRKDYTELAQTLGATVLYHSATRATPISRAIGRVFGEAAALAWVAFRQRKGFDAIVTDGEHIGIPLALLLKLAGASTAHVTIGHRLSTPKKRLYFRWLKAHSHLTRIVLHSWRQYQHAVAALGIPAGQLALVPYQVDQDFWRPQPVPEEPLICSAGLEHRDYPTLFRAVDGLDAQVVIGAASYWSKVPNSAHRATPPGNVRIAAFDYFALRDLYARAAVVVVPLEDVDNQSGITTLLEAMAMGKAVVATHAQGQTDTIEDRRAITRGTPPRARPVSLLRSLAEEAGLPVEPNGFYVPPGDVDALRRAIVYLLDHPSERAALGAAGRRAVEQLLTIEHFASRMRRVVEEACRATAAPPRTTGQARPLVTPRAGSA
jgi:glycosyltransferase involved in cell wall biosynthesis